MILFFMISGFCYSKLQYFAQQSEAVREFVPSFSALLSEEKKLRGSLK